MFANKEETMEPKNSRTILLNEGNEEDKRQEILHYFQSTFDLDEQLYDHLARDEAFYLRAEPLRHPLIFYFGHTASFYLNKLHVARLIDRRINPAYESMFAIGVDEMSWDDLNEQNYDWPTVGEVRAYRKKVRKYVSQVIQELPLSMPITWDSPFWVIMMGIEHQRIHLETSSVIIRRLPIEEVRSLPGWDICPLRGKAPENKLLPVQGGKVVLGKTKQHPLYGWDNEFGVHKFEVWDFKTAKFLVSNGEFLQFVEDNGYQKEQYWTEEGRKWIEFSKADHPVFWLKEPGGYRLRTLSSIIDMAWSWPVEVNYLEAKAFCNWLAEKKVPQSGCQLKMNGIVCMRCTASPINLSGNRLRAISTWSTGLHLVLSIIFNLVNSTISSAMSGSGRKRLSAVLKVLRCIPAMMIFLPLPLIPSII